jgi:methionyl-tRNA formyltransferase
VVTTGSLRVVFFGTPEFATASLQALIGSPHRVVAVVSQPDRPKGRGHQVQATPTKLVARAHDLPVIQPVKIKDESFHQAIRDLQPDLGVVVAFGRILPDALLAIPRLGMINVHASLLPRYRGAAPIQRAVLAGDAETGVTIMRVITEMDAGPMFASGAVPIPADATSEDMGRTLAVLGARLLLPVVDALAAGHAVETPQDASRATHAAKITKAEGAIDWTEPSHVIHNKVRGLQPWPLASTQLAGDRLVLRRTTDLRVRSAFAGPSVPGTTTATNTDLTPDAPTNTDLAPDGAAAPGTIVHADADGLVVACGGGTALRVLEIQPEGRRTMTAREFVAGRRALVGARFEP